MDSSIDTSLGQFQYKGNRVDMADNDLLSVSCPDDNGFVTDLKINRNEIYADERKDAFSIWLLIQVYNKLSDMEKVNYWKEYLKRCPYPVPEFLQYK